MKYDFYYAHGIKEVVIIDPETHTVEWFGRGPETYSPTKGSALLGITAADLTIQIAWPA